jgi:hypothetical protein
MIMKKSVIYFMLLGLITLMSCRDESLNPVPTWNPAVHYFGVFDNGATTKNGLIGNYGKNFPAANQDAPTATVPMKVRWVSLDNKLTVSKIDVYVEMIEYYQDADKNDKQVSLGNKVVKTISAPAGNRQWNSFNISATEVYNLFKDATVKYDKVNAVKVFDNPANPRPKGQWFNGSEDFVVTWVLTTSEGKVFNKFNETSICGDVTSLSEASANCRLTFNVNPCEFESKLFETGTWSVVTDDWNDFKPGAVVSVKPGAKPDEILVELTSNDTNRKDIILTVAKSGAVKIAKQAYGSYGKDPVVYSAEGTGTVNGCKGIIDLVIKHTGSDGYVFEGSKFRLVRK